MVQTREATSLVPVTKFAAHGTYITRVLLSPDVRHLATCSADHTASIWQVDPGVTASTGADPPKLAASHGQQNGQTNGDAGEGPAANQAIQPFPLMMVLDQHQRWVWDCAFSADSAYLVTACSDHYARLWDLSSEKIIRQYNGHHRGAVCVALNDTAVG